MVTDSTPETSNTGEIKTAEAYGQQAGRSHTIAAIERRVEKILAQRGELSVQQLVRLKAIFYVACTTIDPQFHGGWSRGTETDTA